MSKIQILDKIIANRISAGEVVERPASVVKELFENSIDAGADKIIIEIEEGGTKSITITDNGHGIEKGDVLTAFMPHSTSKINSLEDLENIVTLGFRGEALASISSVSQVEMITKTKDETTATKVIIEGGEKGIVEEISSNNGTKISVKNIFFNTPARRKFLRKNKTEESDITNLVERFLLSNPQISIKYVVDGKVIYNTTGSGLFDNIYTIYGKEVANNLIEINAERKGFRLSGYIGKPEISKPNRTYQTLIINGRIVQNFLVSSAVGSAYQNFLMKNRFPFYVLNLEMPFDSLDVNVHPSKQEVKFENTNFIYGFFANSVTEALYSSSHIKSIQDENFEKPLQKTENSLKQNSEDLTKNFNLKTTELSFKNLNSLKVNETDFNNLSEIPVINILDLSKNIKNKDECRAGKNAEIKTFNKDEKENNSASKISKNLNLDCSDILKFKNFKNEIKTASTIKFKSDESNISKIFLKKFKDLNASENLLNQVKPTDFQSQVMLEEVTNVPIKVVGTLFNTYIITEKEDKFFIIDQHAGHERKLYDNLIKEIEKNELIVQDLMIAYTFNCNTLEYQFFMDNLDKFKKLGFFMEPFGHNNIKLTKIPMLLVNLNLKEFIAQKACKSAVKAGNVLSLNEIVSLVEDLEKSQVLLCPHGRPIIIEITKKQLEKWFKRLV